MSNFSVNRQYDEHLPPVVYFHFETDQRWINHGAQFVMEELTFARVNRIVIKITLRSTFSNLYQKLL